MAPKAKKQPAVQEPKRAEKRKAEEESAATPAAKESKAESKTAEKVEQEKDAPADSRPTISGQVGFNTSDLTLNVVSTLGDRLLTVLNDNGLQHFIAGARMNVGMKSGRYMFEVKILEVLTPADVGGGRCRPPMPKQLLRIGVSTAGSSLVLGDSVEHVCFDSEGLFYALNKKSSVSKRFARDQVIAVVLNLDAKSPNANTVSLFCEGERIAEPQPIPESLHGKTLYPHISFRNVTVQVLMEAEPTKALPFKCRTLQGAAKDEVVVSKQKLSKYNVVFPVGVPDEGTYDWLDSFLAKNPGYVELSERKIGDWAVSSGVWKNKPIQWKHSNDKPDFNWGLPNMDDRSAQRIIANIAPIVPRNYVVMEVKSNLTAAERHANLARFGAAHFKKVAHVVMGDPGKEYIKAQQEIVLKEKQEKLDAAWKQKKIEFERRKQIRETKKKAEEMRQQKIAETKKKAEEEKAKREAKLAEDKAKTEAEKKEKEGKDDKAEGDEKKDEAKKEDGKEEKKAEKKEDKKEDKKEEKKDEAKEEAKEEKKEDVEMKDVKEEEKKEEEKKEEEEEEFPAEPEKALLTEEEQQRWFRQLIPKDLTESMLATSFADFTVPDKAEGFDEVVFEWQKEAKSKEYLKNWVLNLKRTSRMEDLKPSRWFSDKLNAWQKLHGDYQTKQKELKTKGKKEGDKKDKDKKEEADDDEIVDVPTAVSEIMGVKDVADVGGMPMFNNFIFEDWALTMLRYEFYLLLRAFQKDTNDAERVITEEHVAFYYTKYFSKALNPKPFGVATVRELTDLIKDTVDWSADKVLTTSLGEDEDLGMFVKLTEEKRRLRQRRIDAGDETARVKFEKTAIQKATPGSGKPQHPQNPQNPQKQSGGQRSGPYDRANSWRQQ